ncbi:MAG: CBS domain-containing protein [Oscillospiraceae bacterium]|nr:CBS domain-containing protein [Oscillospiraceae bacterium]
MEIRDLMTPSTVSVTADESVAHAARLMARHNVGSLPVRGEAGRLCGIVTDRDLVVRCLAAGDDPLHTTVGAVMTPQVSTAAPTDTLAHGAHVMAKRQVRRLPIVDRSGRLCGMLSLSDVAKCRDFHMEAASCLTEISRNVKKW